MLRSVLVLGILLILNGLISGDFVKYEITDPWMVKIKFSSEDMEFGGTFVHENFILTKATVFLNNLINSNEATIMDFEVFMFRRNFTNKNVVEIFFHEDYNKKLLLQDRFDFALVKIDLDYRHGVPVLLLRSHDVSKMHVVYFEEKKNLTLLPKDQCYNGFDLCTATSALHDVTRSFGSGLVYYDPIEKENYLLGIFSSFSYLTNTKEYLENYVSTNGNLVDWVEAHTSDDTLTVENYCYKSDNPKKTLKLKIHTQGQYFKFDWQVRIFNNITQTKCGGSLIKSDVILTAALCTKLNDGKTNENSYSIKFRNIPSWQSDIVEKVEYCEDCHDSKHGLFPGDHNIAMMFITIQTDLQTIIPMKSPYSKSLEDLIKESYVHYALAATIRSDFEIGQATFTTQRFISELDCSRIYPGIAGRVCTKDRQEYTTSSHDIGSGLIYCNEETGESQLYGVLLATDKSTRSNLYGFLKYYEHWVHF